MAGVKDRLKAPATADFPWDAVRTKELGSCRFQVEAYVDAQNSFGAMIRTRYSATMIYANDTWRLDDLKTW
jgi:hypothetical protein